VDRNSRRAGAVLIAVLTLAVAACSGGSPSSAPPRAPSTPAPSGRAPSTSDAAPPTVAATPAQSDTGQRVLPELATAYLDRGRQLPGMITGDSPVVAAFRAAGWTWGGDWSSPTDLMHFSSTGH
jgi:hypothetical protein